MPRTAVRIDVPVCRLCQREMDRAAFLRRGGSVDRGTRQWVAEAHALADRQQPMRLCLFRVGWRDAEPVGRMPQQQRIANWLPARGQAYTPCVIGERLEPSDEALPNLP